MKKLEIGTDSYVKKVPNGFIYTDLFYEDNPINIESERKLAAVSTTFVSYNKQFNRDIAEIKLALKKIAVK